MESPTGGAAADVSIELGPAGAASAAARGDVIIVVDALRASSTIVTGLAHGLLAVRPVRSPEECSGDLTAGERGGCKLPGLDLDNSPIQFADGAYAGRELVLVTTNGTACIAAAASSPRATVLIGCLLNATAVATTAGCIAQREGRDISLVVAGRNNGLAHEDLVAASEIFFCLPDARLRGDLRPLRSDDFRRDFLDSDSGRNLVALGKTADVVFCARKDVYPLTPVFLGGRLVTAGAEATRPVR